MPGCLPETTVPVEATPAGFDELEERPLARSVPRRALGSHAAPEAKLEGVRLASVCAFSEALIQLLALAVMAENVDAVDLRVPVTVEPGVERDRRRNGSNRRET